MDKRNPRRWLILVVLCLSTLVLVIDNMALTVAVPPMAEDLHASAQDLQWILDSYMLVFAGLLLTSGSLSDRYGRRKVMVIGLVLFGLASLAATFAASPGQVILARVVMGVGATLIMPSTLSILITVFDEDERRKAMAVWSSVAMLGLVGGPIVGGTLISWFWWGAVFLINVPVAGVALVAALILMPESKGPRTKPDPLGAILSVIGMTALVWWIIELPKGAGHPGTMAALVVAITALAAFAMWEIRTAEPMVPLGLFKHRNFAGGSFSLTLVQIGNGGLLLVLTQYLQFVLGYSPTEAGLAFIPMAVALLAFNTLGATLGQKIGNRAMTVTGLAVVAAAFGILTTVNTGSGFAIPALGLFVLGAGAGLAGPAAVSALMGEIPPEKAGVGSALNDTIQQMGAALGVAILGSVLSSRYADAMPDDAPAAARHSIAAALGDANLAGSARHAFADAMSTTFVAGTCGVLAAAALAFAVMRDRTTDGTPLTEAREPVHS